MTQKWKKLGRIFSVDKNSDWMFSHASVPFIEKIKDDLFKVPRFKVYFSTRNLNNESSIGYIIFDINNIKTILEISKKPVLEKGSLGTFDDSGVMGTSIVNVNGRKYLYYVGWNIGVTVPFRNAIGLAVSDGCNAFRRAFNGPILDRNKEEPYFTASNCVINDNGLLRIWYLSCTGWEKHNNKIIHYYHIKYAESTDGINWDREGVIAIDYRDKYEYAISVPRVIKEKGLYKMWYSYRAQKNIDSYRIGYAESPDAINWIRKDEEVGIDVSESGWDSEMICYPFVFDHKGKRYMLYNGNGYGKTGFGLAVLEED